MKLGEKLEGTERQEEQSDRTAWGRAKTGQCLTCSHNSEEASRSGAGGAKAVGVIRTG